MITKLLQNWLAEKRIRVVLLTFGVLMSMNFTPVSAQVQNTVTLPENAAGFYFERHFGATIMEQRVDIRDKMIKNLEKQLLAKDSIIRVYNQDKKLYEVLLSARDSQYKLIDEDIKTLKKEARKQKFQKKVILIVGVVLLTLTATQ